MTSPERSRIMRAVKGKNTKPELIVRKLLHAAGYRYRLHRADLPGKPDMVFPGRRKAVFVHGCFWHGHDCKRGARAPKENADYWRTKIARNKERDCTNRLALESCGWSLIVVWECELADLPAVKDRLATFLNSPMQTAGQAAIVLRRDDARYGIVHGLS
jgi:DNA mismatch endonuclease (patch repair protein)